MKYSKIFVISALLYSSTTMAMEIRQLQAVHNREDDVTTPAATSTDSAATTATTDASTAAPSTAPAANSTESTDTSTTAPVANNTDSTASTTTTDASTTAPSTAPVANNTETTPTQPASEIPAATTPEITPEAPIPETISVDGTKVVTQEAIVPPTAGAPASDATVVVSDEAVKEAAEADQKTKEGTTITGDLTKANNETSTSVPASKETTTPSTTAPAAGKAKEGENSTIKEEVGKAGPAKLSGYNGGDEDDIMQKVLKELSVYGRDSTNNKTSQMFLAKDKAKRAGEIILEATHKLTEQEVPAWIEKNFESSWDKYDQNKEGFIRYEEASTFIRSLMGHSSKFVAAPGSISDMSSGGNVYKLDSKSEFTKVGHT